MRLTTKTLAFSLICLPLLLTGCLTTSTSRGYNLDRLNQQKSAIITGKTTASDVVRILGTPSTTSTYGEETWYYIASKTKSVAFLNPKITEQKVLAVAFNNAGNVSHINEYGLDDALVLSYSKDYTHTEGTDLTVLQQLLGNVGRFNSEGASSHGPRLPRGGVDGY